MKPLIFFAFSNLRVDDPLHPPLDLANEWRAVSAALKPAEDKGVCRVDRRQNAMIEEILDFLQDQQNREQLAVFHFGGHANGFQLLMENVQGAGRAAHAESLAQLCSGLSQLKLIFLNGCSTEPQVEALLDAGVPCVIATSQEIHDQVAIEFSERFYKSLAGNATIQRSFDDAVASVKTLHEGNVRKLYFGKALEVLPKLAERWPWKLNVKPGCQPIADQSIGDWAEDPLFGLPKLPPLDYPQEPYVHLEPYTVKHANVFFGRGREISKLFQHVTDPGAAPVICYYGQSGVGKSSVLHAGFLPRLAAIQRVDLVRRLPEGLLASLRKALDVTEQDTDLKQVWLARETQGKPQTVILDQVEEVFTRPNEQTSQEELGELFAQLKHIFTDTRSRPKGKIILAYRKEWSAEIEHLLKQFSLPYCPLFLRRLEANGVKEAIRMSPEVRQRYGLQIQGLDYPDQNETGELPLVDVLSGDLLADAGSPVAPTMQVLLSKMWKAATSQENRSQPRFTLDLYRTMKTRGIELGQFIDEQLAEIEKLQPDVLQHGLALDVLNYHTTDLGTAAQRSHAELKDAYAHIYDNHVEPFIQHCKERHLLVEHAADTDVGDRGTRLAHDTLAPLVRVRFNDSNKIAQRARRVLSVTAHWETSQADEEEPAQATPALSRSELSTVTHGRTWMRKLSSEEKQLVAASTRALKTQRMRQAVVSAGLFLLLMPLVVFLWIQSSRDRDKRLANMIGKVTPENVNVMITEFKRDPRRARRLLRDKAQGAEVLSGTAQFHVSLLQAHLGNTQTQAQQLVDYLAEAQRSELGLVQDALQLCDQEGEVDRALRRWVAGLGDDTTLAAKATAFLVQSHRTQLIPPEWYSPANDPHVRTAIILRFSTWIYDHDSLISAWGLTMSATSRSEDEPGSPRSQRPPPPDLLSLVCQALWVSDDWNTKGYPRPVLGPWVAHEQISVRSSALALMRKGADSPGKSGKASSDGASSKEPISSIDEANLAAGAGRWYSIDYPLAPAGESRVANPHFPLDIGLVDSGGGNTFWLSTTEVPAELFHEFLTARNQPPPAAGEASLPAQAVTWVEALGFCNWLTEATLGAEHNCYERDDTTSPLPTWIYHPERSGYRLPIAAEWKTAAAARSEARFAFGDEAKLLQHYGWTLEWSDNRVHRIATTLPNAWGFFDMHGNLREWAWPSVGNEPTLRQAEGHQILTKDGNFAQLAVEARLTDSGTRYPDDSEDPRVGFRIARSAQVSHTTAQNTNIVARNNNSSARTPRGRP